MLITKNTLCIPLTLKTNKNKSVNKTAIKIKIIFNYAHI